MTFTDADLNALKAALISGAMEVSIGDRTVKYKSTKDLMAAIKLVQAYLNASDSATGTAQNVPATFNKGRV